MDGPSTAWFFVLFVLILLSALFSGSETAYTAISRARLRQLKEEGVRKAEKLERLTAHPPRLLSAILLGNNLVNILAASAATNLAVQTYGDVGVGIATGILTFLILVFGEITPKTFAVRNPERFALATLWVFYPLYRIFYPLSRIFVFIANITIRLFGQPGMKEGPFLTAEELKTLVVLGEEEGVIEEEEKRMIHSILEFGDTTVKEVMVPRTEMTCLDLEMTLANAVEIAREKGFSRIPVYEGNIDNIVGILYVKDMLNFITLGKLELKVKELMREPYFVPETKRVDDLLREFQKNKIHMAIVIDEYGGTSGLVTLEDILEEIVGEIFDEYDFMEEARIDRISENEWVIDGRVDIDAVEELFGFEIEEEDTETLGGFVSSLIGHFPAPGEKCVYKGYEFTVEEVENRRVGRVRVIKIQEGAGESSNERQS